MVRLSGPGFVQDERHVLAWPPRSAFSHVSERARCAVGEAVWAHFVARSEVGKAEIVRPNVFVALHEEKRDAPKSAIAVARDFLALHNARAKRNQVVDQALPPQGIVTATRALHVRGAETFCQFRLPEANEGGTTHAIDRGRFRIWPRVSMKREGDNCFQRIDVHASHDRVVISDVAVARPAHKIMPEAAQLRPVRAEAKAELMAVAVQEPKPRRRQQPMRHEVTWEL